MTTIPRRPLGKTGLVVSALGFGGAPIGFAEAVDEAGLVSLVRRAVELGITFFDTAPDYRRSEALLGEALEGRRAGVVLATKVGRLQTPTAAGWEVREDWSIDGVRRTVETSLRRLRTDYLDLIQLHSPPIPVLEDRAFIRAFERLRHEGLARHLGLSADGEVAWRALELGVFETLQGSYSVLEQEPGRHLVPNAHSRGVGVIVKQPLANGVSIMPDRPAHPDWAAKWDLAQRIDWGAAETPGGRLGLALRWLLADPAVSTAIVGTTRPEHLDANVAAALAPPLDHGEARRLRLAYAAARQKLSGRSVGARRASPAGLAGEAPLAPTTGPSDPLLVRDADG